MNSAMNGLPLPTRKRAGTTTTVVFIMALLVAFLVLAAQYESWTLSPVCSSNGNSGGITRRNAGLLCDGNSGQHLYANRYNPVSGAIRQKRYP